MFRNWWFSVKEFGAGGSLLVVPMANWGFGGEVGSRERMWLLMERPSGCTYLGELSTLRSNLEQICIQHEDFLQESLRFSDRFEWLVGEPSSVMSLRTWLTRQLGRGKFAPVRRQGGSLWVSKKGVNTKISNVNSRVDDIKTSILRFSRALAQRRSGRRARSLILFTSQGRNGRKALRTRSRSMVTDVWRCSRM